QGVSIVQYRLPQVLDDQAFFQFYQQAAQRAGWQPVLQNAVRPGQPTVIYQFPGGKGVLSVHGSVVMVNRPVMNPRPPAPGRPAQPGVTQQIPTTYLTVILLEGDINVGKALPGLRPGPAPGPEPPDRE